MASVTAAVNSLSVPFETERLCNKEKKYRLHRVCFLGKKTAAAARRTKQNWKDIFHIKHRLIKGLELSD